jgi:hypothetical protein
VKQHTGLEAHDGYAPHSHEVRADHKGVEFRGSADRNGIPIPDGWALYYDGELVYSASKDEWASIGPVARSIMEIILACEEHGIMHKITPSDMDMIREKMEAR